MSVISILRQRSRLEFFISILIIILCILVGFIMPSHPWGWLLLAGFGGLVILLVANYFPTVTIILLLASSILAQNLKPIFPILDPYKNLGPFAMRIYDPFVFSILGVIILKTLLSDKSALRFWKKSNTALKLLAVVIILQTLRTIPRYGINALGEARTYYSQLILIPYISINYDTPEKRKKLLKVLLIISFSIIPVAILRGGLQPNVALRVRWISASGMLAIVYGGFVLLIANNHKLFQTNWLVKISAYIAGGSLLLFTAHRSVWLAFGVGLITLFLLKELHISKQLGMLLLGLTVLQLVLRGFELVGHDPIYFLNQRILAFTNPTADPTARWRKNLWVEAWKHIRQFPILGNGLGKHFQLVIPGEEVTTSPHNLYLTIAYQVGIPALILYLIFVSVLFFRSLSFMDRGVNNIDHTIVIIGEVVILTAHAYYMAYVFDWVTLSYLGLVYSALIFNRSDTKNGI